MHKRSFLMTLGSTVALAAGGRAYGQGGAKAIRIVVPLAAGSSNDYVARVIAPHLGTSLSQTIVIDNKAGANGVIGTMDAVKAAPDGSTLLLASVSPLAVNLALYSNIPYLPQRDLSAIGGVSMTCNVMLVNAAFPARTLAEFIDYAKKHPKEINLGSSTAATTLQIQTMSRLAGIDMQIVPYRGAPAAINDVLGGSLSATFADPGLALAQTKGGRMRALAVSSLKRNPLIPEWPAISETLPDVDFTFWTILAGPAGLPRDIVDRVGRATSEALKQKDVVDKLALSGTVPFALGAEEVRALLVCDAARWARLAREANIKPEPM